MTSEDIRQKIIGCAFKVHNRLGAGFLEKVYENALKVELTRLDLSVRQQAPISVYYEEEIVGEFFADLLVEDRILVELKAVQAIALEHEVQLVNYLTATGIESGLLINFGKSVEIRRKFRDFKQGNPVNPEKSR